jgi:hypothetical protein
VVAEEGAQGLVVVAELELGEAAEGGRKARQALVVGGHPGVKVLVGMPEWNVDWVDCFVGQYGMGV